MNGEDAGEVRIVIDLWHTTYIVPASHPAPEELRARLDGLVTADVPEACVRRLADAVDPADPSVWLIRELNLDFPVDAGRHAADGVAQVWGEQLAGRIRRTLERGEAGEDVLHFPNRAAYLAQFAADLAAGRAWGKWYYEEFESLRSLPPGRAIGEAVTREAALAAGALLRLLEIGRLQDVLRVLTPADARAIYTVCRGQAEGPASDVGIRKWTGVLLELWNETPLRAEEDNLFRDGLWLLALADARHAGSLADPDLSAALDGLLELRRVLAALRSPASLDRLIRSLAQADWKGAVALVSGVEHAEEALRFFERSMQGDADWGVQAAGVLLSEEFRRRSVAANPAYGQLVWTRFGGIFRLGASFLASGIEEMLAAATMACSEADGAAPILRHRIAIACLGRARAFEAMTDPAVRLFTGCKAGFPADAEALSAAVDSGQALAVLARRLVDSGRCVGACLLAEHVALPLSGGSAVLLRDVLQNEWIWVGEFSECAAGGAVEEGVACVCKATGMEPRVVILGEGLGALEGRSLVAAKSARLVSIESVQGSHLRDLAAEFRLTPERLLRLLKPARQDLAYFSLQNLWPETGVRFDLALALAARAVLRHFARRLMGFEASSPEHLFTNFLTGRGTAQDVGGRIEVELEEAPLSVVLRMSGMQSETYIAPWIGREVWLRQSSE